MRFGEGMDIATEELRGLVLPEDSPVVRESPVPPEARDARHDWIFDARTLFYDCVYLETERGFLFTAPPFGALWPVFRRGLRVEGRPVRWLWRRKFGRSEQAFLRAPRHAALSFEGAGLDEAIAIRTQRAETFAGRKLLVTTSKNNDPEWIAQWARFHVQVHGADGLLLFDNGSTDYTLDELAAVLTPIAGLDVVRLVSVPFSFGGSVVVGETTHRLWYLQVGMLNLARRDMAAKAQAVLNADIDEFVLRDGALTIFEAASRAAVRGVMIAGSWVYPAPETPLPCPPHRNTMRAVPDQACNRKWCAVPRGWSSRLGGWTAHAFGSWVLRGWRQNGRHHPDFRLAHCAGTTTGWKADSMRFDMPDQMRHDPDLAAALAQGQGAP